MRCSLRNKVNNIQIDGVSEDDDETWLTAEAEAKQLLKECGQLYGVCTRNRAMAHWVEKTWRNGIVDLKN